MMRSTVGTGDSANLKICRREKLNIPRETVHKPSAVYGGAVRILVISCGEFEEGDIVRLEDVYGRAGADGDAKERGGGSRGTGPT